MLLLVFVGGLGYYDYDYGEAAAILVAAGTAVVVAAIPGWERGIARGEKALFLRILFFSSSSYSLLILFYPLPILILIDNLYFSVDVNFYLFWKRS